MHVKIRKIHANYKLPYIICPVQWSYTLLKKVTSPPTSSPTAALLAKHAQSKYQVLDH